MKFEVGEIAILTRNSNHRSLRGVHSVGDECEILAVGPFPAGYSYDGSDCIGEPRDYIIGYRSIWYGINQDALRKRYPPGSEIVKDMLTQLPREMA